MNEPTRIDGRTPPERLITRIAALFGAGARALFTATRRQEQDPQPSDNLARAEAAVSQTSTPIRDRPLLLQFAEIEAAAIEVYAEHGLPVRPGHYARSSKQAKWRFLAEHLTAEERWEFALVQRRGAKWRFGALEDLGSGPDCPERVQVAARSLATLRHLRGRLGTVAGTLDEDLHAAMQLGADWRRLTDTPARSRAEGLRFSAPGKSGRRQRDAV